MSSASQRPQHRRNPSNKSNILRSLVSSKSRPASPEATTGPVNERTKSMPFLPPDHPHASKSRPLSERQGNLQSPPSSPPKSRQKSVAAPKTSREDGASGKPVKTKDGSVSPKKSKSSTNLSGLFARMNRSSKDLPAAAKREKENTSPPSSTSGPVETPIWAQFAANGMRTSRPSTRGSTSSSNVHEEIAKYTPREYCPSNQRNFNGTSAQPALVPTLNSRPQSAYVMGTESIIDAIGRRVSGGRTSIDGWRSEDSGREYKRRVSGEKPISLTRHSTERKASGSSTEQAPEKNKLNIAKRGGRVLAAVAAFQGKTKETSTKAEPTLAAHDVDQAFEAVLESRNIPEPMRRKMRSLTLRVKADFVKQDQGSKTAGDSPVTALAHDAATAKSPVDTTNTSAVEQDQVEDDSRSTKRSRPRSRTFTFSKADKRSGDASPSKKHRSQSKSRPTSVYIPKEQTAPSSQGGKSTPTALMGSHGKKAANPTLPAEYIAYLKDHQDPTTLEVGRLHKLRILLRNETVTWVDSFVSLGGMTEIVALLHRTMALEWREEHEDQLLHEALLCLKGLCTTEKAMAELEKVADGLFPSLLQMLFDEEKKGPAEYTTRTIIINVLFNFLSSATGTSPSALEHRARRILTYLGEPQKPEDARPVDFVLNMHTPRPYKLWCREVSHVTKEVFWIFLHHLNVVPLPKNTADAPADVDVEPEERARALAATYTHRHFPGSRPPVPAAPYIGGVEWDATTYLAAHLDLLNGLISSIPTVDARNTLRAEMRASGFERTMGTTLRTCKEKFYSGVHDGLRAWAAAAHEDGWETRSVREGPTMEEQAARARSASPKKSPKKKTGDEAPRIEALPPLGLDNPRLDLRLDGEIRKRSALDNDGDDGWLG